MAVGRFLHPFARPAKEDFVTIVRGEGALVYDDHGREYVDGMASLWYANIGYGRHEITEAVAAQMDRIAAFHCFEPFTNEPAEQVSARCQRPRAHRRRPCVPHQQRIRGRRLRDQARPHRALQCRPSRAFVDREPWPRLPRRHLRRALGAGPAREPGGLRPLRRVDGQPAARRHRGDGRVHGRARPRGRGDHHRAGARRGRRLPTTRRLPRRSAATRRPARRLLDLRRGDLRLRPARRMVRCAALRRDPRSDHVRESDHVGLHPARRRGDRWARACTARGRRHVDVATRPHLQRPPHGGCRRAREPRRDGARRSRRRAPRTSATASSTGLLHCTPTVRSPRCAAASRSARLVSHPLTTPSRYATSCWRRA